MKSNVVALIFGCFLFAVGGEVALRSIARVSPAVQLIATAGMKLPAPQFHSLEDYVRAKPNQLRPHQGWFNYFNNNFGFNDKEFAETESPGSKRILALGDSFLFGLAPYPFSVGTLLENQLVTRCGGRIEILNAGVPSTGAWDYHELARLLIPRFHPRYILVHFYLGNDGPDLLSGKSDIPPASMPFFQSYLVRTFKNSLKLWRGVKLTGAAESLPNADDYWSRPNGGDQVRAGQDFDEKNRALVGPTFSESEYDSVLADEVTRLAVAGNDSETAAWQPIIDQLQEIRTLAANSKIALIFVLYPSQLQLKEDLFKRAIDACFRLKKPCKNLTSKDFDALRPNKFLIKKISEWGLPVVDLTPKLAQQAAEGLYILNDTHWNIRGNRLAAELEAEAVAPQTCG